MEAYINIAFGVLFLMLLLFTLPIFFHFGKALYILAYTWSHIVEKWSTTLYSNEKKDIL